MRRRFIAGTCFSLLLFVGTVVGVGLATGDTWRTILVSILGIFFFGSSICIAYFDLRRRYTRASESPR